MKEKPKYKDDDGHTIYNMNVDGMRGYKPKNNSQIYLTKKEKRAMIKAAYKAYFLPFIIVILGFLLALLLIYFIWLK